jgi:uncharacterized protein
MVLTPGQWLWALGAVFLTGLGKGGVPGVGTLTVVIFATVFDAKQSVGLLLPVLIAADLVAITVYRRHCDWRQLARLLPWMLVGIILGYLLFDHLPSDTFRRLIGVLVLGFASLQATIEWLRRQRGVAWAAAVSHGLPWRMTLGIGGGFATMIANAAGPISQLYFLAIGLPKWAFIGTGAWCFFIVNLLKVPLQWELGIIHGASLEISLWLAPAAMVGVMVGPLIVRYIPQQVFNRIVWLFILVAGVRLL